MAKNKLNFNGINKETFEILMSFKKARFELACLNESYKTARKPILAEIKNIESKRNELLANGIETDEVIKKYPRIEEDNKLRLLKEQHETEVKPLKETINKAYTNTVPSELYNAYVKKIDEDKCQDFLDAIRQFLTNIGYDGLRPGQVNRFANSIAPKIGAKLATDNYISKNNKLSRAYTEAQFRKLFLAVFIDSYVSIERATEATENPTTTEVAKPIETVKATKKSTKTKKEETEFLKLDKKEISETDLDIIHDTYPTIISKNLGVTDKADFEEIELSLGNKTISVYVCLAE